MTEVFAGHLASWDGSSWRPVYSGLSAEVAAVTVFDGGSGPALYVAGSFLRIGDVFASRIAKWDGTTWSALGSGLSGTSEALAVFDDGTGPALYAAGPFSVAGGLPAN